MIFSNFFLKYIGNIPVGGQNMNVTQRLSKILRAYIGSSLARSKSFHSIVALLRRSVNIPFHRVSLIKFVLQKKIVLNKLDYHIGIKIMKKILLMQFKIFTK